MALPDRANGSVDAAWQYCLSKAAERRSRSSAEQAANSAAAQSLHSADNDNIWRDAALELVLLYGPMFLSPPSQTFALGHLAQSIDGNIATDSGSSRGLSGEANHVHLHRLRALADVVIVGASTALLDDPQLTVRLAIGPNPARLVIDPRVRVPTHLRMFSDAAAPTLIVCARENASAAIARWGSAQVIAVDATAGLLDLRQLRARLVERGWSVLLVEGGGVTVSRMFEAGCLEWLQISVSPVLVGGSRRGLQLSSLTSIDDCPRPRARVFQMGEDMLWDLDLGSQPANRTTASPEALKRIV